MSPARALERESSSRSMLRIGSIKPCISNIFGNASWLVVQCLYILCVKCDLLA